MSHVKSRATPGNISKYVNAFNVRVKDPVAALFRVSTLAQGKRSSLRFQEEFIPKLIELHGGIIVHQASFEWSGRGPEWIDKVSAFFDEAIKQGATKVVALSADRYLRSRLFDGKANWDFTPTDREWRELKEASGRLELQSIVPPRFTPGQVREAYIEGGLMNSGRKRGKWATTRKAFKDKWKPTAMEMAFKGYSLKRIAEHITCQSNRSISHVAVWKWLREGIKLTIRPS